MEKKFEFRPRQWVLTRYTNSEWILCQFSHKNKDGNYVMCGGSCFPSCIPYKGNKYLIGTTKPYVELHDGDFVYMEYKSFNGFVCRMIYIYKEGGHKTESHMMYDIRENKLCYDKYICQDEKILFLRIATEKERNLFLFNLHKNGKDWYAERKQIVAYDLESTVSPYTPKDGDFIVSGWEDGPTKCCWIAVLKGDFESDYYRTYAGAYLSAKNDSTGREIWTEDESCDGHTYTREATEEEKTIFFAMLKARGLAWDNDKKEVVPIAPEYQPKDGDFVKDDDGSIFIYKPSGTDIFADCYVGYTDGDVELVLYADGYTDIKYLTPASDEETSWLLRKMHDFGKDWDAEKKQVVDYEPPYEPKNGDFVVCSEGDERKSIFIFEKMVDDKVQTYCVHFFGASCTCCVREPRGFDSIKGSMRAATEVEENQFLSELHKIGKDWDAENKVLVNWKWIPNEGDAYCFPGYNSALCKFEPFESCWDEDSVDTRRLNRNYVFRKKDEPVCQALCDKLNGAINNVK